MEEEDDPDCILDDGTYSDNFYNWFWQGHCSQNNIDAALELGSDAVDQAWATNFIELRKTLTEQELQEALTSQPDTTWADVIGGWSTELSIFVHYTNNKNNYYKWYTTDSRCSANEYYSKSDKACLDCPEGSAKCSKPEGSFECEPGYELIEGKNLGYCLEPCPSGFYRQTLFYKNKEIKEAFGISKLNDIWDEDKAKQSCRPCKEGCAKCIYDEYFYGTKESAPTTSFCYACEVGYELDYTTNECIDSIPGSSSNTPGQYFN